MLVIDAAALAEMRAHAEEAYPEECCGVVLATPSGQLVRRMTNVQNQLHAQDPVAHPRDARTAYDFDSRELLEVIRMGDRPGGRSSSSTTRIPTTARRPTSRRPTRRRRSRRGSRSSRRIRGRSTSCSRCARARSPTARRSRGTSARATSSRRRSRAPESMATLRRDGFHLHYDVHGDGEDVVVFTHGLGASGDTWSAQVAALAPCYRVVTWDLRAHARSGSLRRPRDAGGARGRSRRGRARGRRRPAGPRGRPLGGRRRHDAVRARSAGAGADAGAGRHRQRGERARGGVLRVVRRSPPSARVARRSSAGSARATRARAIPSRTGSRALARAMGSLHTTPITAELGAIRCPVLDHRRREGLPRRRRLGDHEPSHRGLAARDRARAGARDLSRGSRRFQPAAAGFSRARTERRAVVRARGDARDRQARVRGRGRRPSRGRACRARRRARRSWSTNCGVLPAT